MFHLGCLTSPLPTAYVWLSAKNVCELIRTPSSLQVHTSFKEEGVGRDRYLDVEEGDLSHREHEI